ncbi:MAG: SapC family protein [Thermodesulfobacteriota bacterium]
MHQQETYIPVLLTGLGSEQNLFVNADGKWIGNYLPACVRTGPFAQVAWQMREND